jgi:hypothetical protein
MAKKMPRGMVALSSSAIAAIYLAGFVYTRSADAGLASVATSVPTTVPASPSATASSTQPTTVASTSAPSLGTATSTASAAALAVRRTWRAAPARRASVA